MASVGGKTVPSASPRVPRDIRRERGTKGGHQRCRSESFEKRHERIHHAPPHPRKAKTDWLGTTPGPRTNTGWKENEPRGTRRRSCDPKRHLVTMAKVLVAISWCVAVAMGKPEKAHVEKRQLEGFDVEALLKDAMGEEQELMKGMTAENVKFVESRDDLLRKEEEVIQIQSNPFKARNPFALGPCDPADPIAVEGTSDNGLEGVPNLLVYAPKSLPDDMKFTTMVQFSVDQGAKPLHYKSFLQHLVTHGYTVIVPDVEEAIATAKDDDAGYGWLQKSAQVASKVSEWSEKLPTLMEEHNLQTPLQADTDGKPVLVLLGHGAGSASQVCLVVGCLEGAGLEEPSLQNLHIASLISVDPVNLDEDHSGLKLEDANLKSKHGSIPLIVWSAGGGVQPEQVEETPADEGCVPEKLNHQAFLDAWSGPKSNVKTQEAGHDDVLDDGLEYRDTNCPSAYSSDNREAPRSFISGVVTGFSDALLGRGRTLEEFKLMLKIIGLESEVLERIESAVKTETSQTVDVNGGADAAMKEWERALSEDDVKVHHVKRPREDETVEAEDDATTKDSAWTVKETAEHQEL